MSFCRTCTRYILFFSWAWVSVAPAAVTLNDAYQSAVTKTEPVQIQHALAAQTDERIGQISGKLLPALNLNGNYTYQDPTGANAGATSAFTRSDQYSLRLTVTQPIFHGLGEWAEWRSRKAARSAAELREQNLRLTLWRTVADAYYSVLAEETDCKNIEEILRLTEKQVRELKDRVNIGRSRLGDRLTMESKVSTVRAQLIQQRAVLATARETFRAVTGLASETELDPAVDRPPQPMPLAPLVADIEKRPDFEAAKKDFEAADESVSVLRAAHWPSLDAQANYYLTRTGVLANSKWDAGLVLVFPLFAGGTIDAAVGEGVQKRKAAELTLALLRRTAEQELRTAHAACAAAVEQEKELLEALNLSEKNYETQLRDFRNGLVTTIDVLNALNTLASTRRDHDRLLISSHALRIRLEVAAGKMPSHG